MRTFARKQSGRDDRDPSVESSQLVVGSRAAGRMLRIPLEEPDRGVTARTSPGSGNG